MDIFNISFSQAVVPVCLKMCSTVPVPRDSAVKSMNDYCLTSEIMKCFKWLVLAHIKDSFNNNAGPPSVCLQEEPVQCQLSSTLLSSQKAAVGGTKTISLQLGLQLSTAVHRPQCVKIYCVSSSTITLNTGCTVHADDKVLLHATVKFADDTVVARPTSSNTIRWKNLWTGAEPTITASMWGGLRRLLWTSGGEAKLPSPLHQRISCGDGAKLQIPGPAWSQATNTPYITNKAHQGLYQDFLVGWPQSYCPNLHHCLLWELICCPKEGAVTSGRICNSSRITKSCLLSLEDISISRCRDRAQVSWSTTATHQMNCSPSSPQAEGCAASRPKPQG